MIGVMFGNLVVVSGPYVSKRGKFASWKVKCGLCGNTVLVPRDSLEDMTHCGCKHHSFLHGKSGTATHQVWVKMLSKCTNPKDPKFKDFGEKGVKVATSWRSFLVFLQDMGEKPEGKTLERINNKGNFIASNCKWGTTREQNCNRRSCLRYTISGKEYALSEIAEMYGIKYQALYRRVRTLNVPLAQALKDLRSQ